ncbi:hypothetical protein GQ44DRAFT_607176 [Phaeosphaeriaceae sp. PMI808]|nr:hypothetical protein GQ44DRAFT_607176 [Phaeosphaeriaceae sp. PMI808]
MHDLKPLMLPKLVAARKSSQTSLNMFAEPTSSIHSSADSGFYSTSECSTPPTPSMHSRGHFRFPSSTSSLSSSPPAHEIIEPPSSTKKLPKLTEEPIEREYDYGNEDPYRCSCDVDPFGHDQECMVSKAYSPENEYFTSHAMELRMAKRRRSLEASAHSIAGKLERRFPSLSRKVRDRNSNMGRGSRSATPSRVPSTRSSSITSSLRHASALDLTDSFTPTATSSFVSREDLADTTPTPMSIDIEKANAIVIDSEEVAAERYATTPLLPPVLLVNCRNDDLPTSSPLQSPTVADGTQSVVATPAGTPPVRAHTTPPLSSKPSIASFKGARAGYAVPSSDIPPMMLADPNDKWANTLGHANFTIHPEPYIPEICDADAVRQLMTDWQQARNNFTKHQVRTAEHYGATSKYYLLTEQKWAEIDAEWKMNHDLAKAHAVSIGQELEPTSPTEPVPMSKMPTLNDPKSEGKFPKLGDEDIVGPMHQFKESPLFQPRTPSKKRAFFKFLADWRFPGSSLLGRPSVGVHGH